MAASKPKVEARSRTSAPYRRAGLTLTPEWQDVPAELVNDGKVDERLSSDPHVDIRIDGKRQAKFEGDPTENGSVPAAAPPADAEVAKALQELSDENDALKRRLADLEDAAKAQAASKADTPTTPLLPDGEPKQSAQTTPSEPVKGSKASR